MGIKALRNQERTIAEQQAWFSKIHAAAEANDVEGWLRLQAAYLKWDNVVSQSRADMVKMLEMALEIVSKAKPESN